MCTTAAALRINLNVDPSDVPPAHGFVKGPPVINMHMLEASDPVATLIHLFLGIA